MGNEVSSHSEGEKEFSKHKKSGYTEFFSSAGKTIGDVVRTCLGPKAMLKMLMDPMGGIVMTNDGNAILREITVQHPAAKSMIEIARTQDEEVGDGTTSVIVLAAEVLGVSQQFLEDKMHPTVIINAYRAVSMNFVRSLELCLLCSLRLFLMILFLFTLVLQKQ